MNPSPVDPAIAGVEGMTCRYPVEILCSDEDEGFMAIVPDLPGCSAFGETEEDALVKVKAAMALWLETARAEGCPIPEPAGRLLARS